MNRHLPFLSSRRPASGPILLLLCSLLLTLIPGVPVAQAQEPPDAAVLPASAPALIPLEGAVDIAAGEEFSCAVLQSGGVVCWGSDGAGQLGNGPATGSQLTSVAVAGLTNAVAVTAGGNHACALTTLGTVLCWGANGSGQLGNDSTLPQTVPVSVVGLTNAVAITAGGLHTCALTATGAVFCWGSDSFGQLGDDIAIAPKQAPVAVSELGSGVRAVAAGDSHTCALLNDGMMRCWGSDSVGQLGNGAITGNQPKPVATSPLGAPAAAIATGDGHTCAVLNTGALKCWGDDGFGQLGDDGPTVSQDEPAQVSGLVSHVATVAAGGFHTCAISTGQGLLCWGYDGQGGLGDSSVLADQSVPAWVVGMGSGVRQAALGREHTCALRTDGHVLCWGLNGSGQVGDNSTLARSLPTSVLTNRTCFALARTAAGSGQLPTAATSRSPGCPESHYLAGAQILLQAAPDVGNRVQTWNAPATGAPGSLLGLLTMPAADTTVAVIYAACRILTLDHTGAGAAPGATPRASAGCAAGAFAAGEPVALLAAPGANQRVAGWTNAAAPLAGSLTNNLTMPDANTVVSVAYAPCFTLTLNQTGSGSAVKAVPAATLGCAAGRYAAGETIHLVAVPATNQRVQQWTGAVVGANAGEPVNIVTMPAANASAAVAYEPCFALTATFSGLGTTPLVSPLRTNGCATSAFVAGERVELLASPAPGWRVAGWSGTIDDASTAAVNAAIMPAGAKSVTVRYALSPAPPTASVRLYLPAVKQ